MHRAEKEGRIIYIRGSVGMGKTAAVRSYYAKRPYRYILCGDAQLYETDPIEEVKEEVMIFDQICRLSDRHLQDYILDVIRYGRKQVVLISRGGIPDWMITASIQHQFLEISNDDLLLTEEDVCDLSARDGIELAKDDYLAIAQDCCGNNLLLTTTIRNMMPDTPYTSAIRELSRRTVFDYMNQVFLNPMPQIYRDTLLSLCQFESFNLELARTVTGNPDIKAVLYQMLKIGDFLQVNGKEKYEILPMYREYLRYRQSVILPSRIINENYERAAVYFELNGDLMRALECYRRSDNTYRLSALLTRIVNEHPGMENYLDTQKYFNGLTVNDIAASPALMAGMSMLSSLTMNILQSEMWYQKLEDYCRESRPGSPEHRDAQNRLMLLDIILPHRDRGELVRQLRNAEQISVDFPQQIVHVSVSDYTPSVINGGLDLCTFLTDLKGETATIGALKKEAVSLLGSSGGMYVDLLLLEVSYERESADHYEINAGINTIYHTANSAGALDIAYGAVGLMVRQALCSGSLSSVNAEITSFQREVDRTEDISFQKSVDTLKMHICLSNGDIEYASQWLSETPDSTISHSIMYRYIFINKVRALILLGRTDEALSLSNRLKKAFHDYHRTYLWIQNEVLQAVLYFRENQELWKKSLEGALLRAEELGFYHVVAEEGAALAPLLDVFESEKINPAFLDRVKEINRQIARYYPQYLKSVKMLDVALTETEHKVIRLMCENLNTDEICECCTSPIPA